MPLLASRVLVLQTTTLKRLLHQGARATEVFSETKGDLESFWEAVKVMKRVLWLTVLALALPLTAFADSVDFTNSGGMRGGSKKGPKFTGSALIAVKDIKGRGNVTGSNLGGASVWTQCL